MLAVVRVYGDAVSSSYATPTYRQQTYESYVLVTGSSSAVQHLEGVDAE